MYDTVSPCVYKFLLYILMIIGLGSELQHKKLFFPTVVEHLPNTYFFFYQNFFISIYAVSNFYCDIFLLGTCRTEPWQKKKRLGHLHDLFLGCGSLGASGGKCSDLDHHLFGTEGRIAVTYTRTFLQTITRPSQFSRL